MRLFFTLFFITLVVGLTSWIIYTKQEWDKFSAEELDKQRKALLDKHRL